MTTQHDAMWAEASRDHQSETDERIFAHAKVAASGLWPFLAAARSEPEFDNRLWLAGDRIGMAVQAVLGQTPDTTGLRARVEASLKADWRTHHAARTAAEQPQRDLEAVAAALGKEASPKATGLCGQCQGKVEVVSGSDASGSYDVWMHEDRERDLDHTVRPVRVKESKQASRYCPTHKVYVGEGNQEQHDHCPVETRKSKDSSRRTAADKGTDESKRDLRCPKCGTTFESGETIDGVQVEAGDRCYDCESGTLEKVSARRTAAEDYNPQTYEEYVQWKRGQGYEPLSQVEWEDRVKFLENQDAVREHFRGMGSRQAAAPRDPGPGGPVAEEIGKFHERAQQTCSQCGGKVHPLAPGNQHLHPPADGHKFQASRRTAAGEVCAVCRGPIRKSESGWGHIAPETEQTPGFRSETVWDHPARPLSDNAPPRQGEPGWETWMSASRRTAADKGWVPVARAVVENRGFKTVDPATNAETKTQWRGDQVTGPGVILDMTTANMLVTVYDALGPANQEKFAAMPIVQAVEFGWKLIRKTQGSRTAAHDMVECGNCGGSGTLTDGKKCPECNGTGEVFSTEASRKQAEQAPEYRCADCGETWRGKTKGCVECGSSAIYPTETKESARKTAEGPTNSWPCQDCGTTVERWRGESDVSCPRCGAQYNAGGQRLRDDWASNPSNWDSEMGDMEGYEISQLRGESARRTATSQHDLEAIRAQDPDAGSTQPTEADYKEFEAWVKKTYGEQAWKDYQGNWDTQGITGESTRRMADYDEDGAPCCMAFVTSGGRFHEPGCPDAKKDPGTSRDPGHTMKSNLHPATARALDVLTGRA